MLSRLPVIALALALAVLPSCKTVQSIIHDDEVVAKLGNHKLYRADLEGIVPSGTPSEDSLNLVNLYINSWATDMAFQDVAQQRLSKEEKDVSKEMEAYRQSLPRYRFEQHYVAERLDTNVSRKEIDDYYDNHKSSFKLQRPILKARFLNIAKDSPSLPEIKRLMSSDDPSDVEAADSAAFGTACICVQDDWSGGDRACGILRRPDQGYHPERKKASAPDHFGTRVDRRSQA